MTLQSTLKAVDGRNFKSQELRAEGPLVILFFRSAW